MKLLKKGTTGRDVKALIADLIETGFLPASVHATTFDLEVLKAVRRFQSQGIGPDSMPLVVDGEVGPLTRFALDVTLKRRKPPADVSIEQPALPRKSAKASVTGWKALQVAKAEVAAGNGETGGDNRGPDVIRYHAVTGAKAGDSWCASFVAYCFDKGNPGEMPYEPTAGARATLQRFRKKGWDYTADLDNPPEPGDIIVWWRGTIEGWKGHIGFVSGYADGIVYTIEGNRGAYPSKVRPFHYKLEKIEKLLGFARAGGT